MSVVFYCTWKRRLKKFGASSGNVAPIHKNSFRHLSTCFTATKIDTIEQRALLSLKEFLLDNMNKENLRIKLRTLYKKISFMQRKMRARFQTKGAKVEVLITYWDKIYGQSQLKASKTKDTEVTEMLMKLNTVPQAVRYECFWQYIRKC